MKINQNVRMIRLSKGVKQNFVAERLGVSPQTYNSYELGRREIRAETLHEISLILDEPIENFFDEKLYESKNQTTA